MYITPHLVSFATIIIWGNFFEIFVSISTSICTVSACHFVFCNVQSGMSAHIHIFVFRLFYWACLPEIWNYLKVLQPFCELQNIIDLMQMRTHPQRVSLLEFFFKTDAALHTYWNIFNSLMNNVTNFRIVMLMESWL